MGLYLLRDVLTSSSPVKVQPRTQRLVWVPAPDRLRNYQGPVAISPPPERVQCGVPLQTARAVARVQDGMLPVVLMNLEHHALSMPSLAPLAIAGRWRPNAKQ